MAAPSWEHARDRIDMKVDPSSKHAACESAEASTGARRRLTLFSRLPVRARDIIVIGASAGGVEAISRIVRDLPGAFPASIFVTMHFPESGISVLPRILTRAGKLRAVHPEDGEAIVPGRIYVAPPDRHLMILSERVRLVRGPRENGHRPAIDPMFRSAAVAYGPRVIGIVLTGNLDDGTSGLMAIERRGGTSVVQDPADALFPSMPASAIDHARADHVVPLDRIASVLVELVRSNTKVSADALERPMSDEARKEIEYSNFQLEAIEQPEQHPGQLSAFACPDCGGVLWRQQEGELVRFRCRVGHAWTTDGLLHRQAETLDSALWMALRALEENASLSEHMAERMQRRGNETLAKRFLRNAESAKTRAAVIQEVLVGSTVPPTEASGRSSSAGDVPLGVAQSSGAASSE
jgi:two-component system, chemotaxis family, protein-glutamate methylesterase/glutaminase